MRMTVDREPRSQTIFDGANIEKGDLVDGLFNIFGTSVAEDRLADILLAEIVRRYVVEDQSSPGAQDQTREFNLAKIAAEIPVAFEPKDLDEILSSFLDRDLATASIPEADIEAAPGCVMLQQAGVQRGLALIDRFVPRVDHPAGTPFFDSRAWTGLSRATIDDGNRDRIIGAIEKAILLVDEHVTDNERHAQAIGYLRAALTLSATPVPPSRMIWELINRAASVAGIFGLVLTLFAAIVK